MPYHSLMARRLALSLVALTVSAAFVTTETRSSGQSAPVDPEARWLLAADAWDAGDYPTALEGLQALMQSPAADAYLERVALLTGELFVSTELTPDGRNPHISYDGRYASYETGPTTSPRTVVVRLDAGTVQPVAELRGEAVVFDPTGPRLAWLRPPTTPEYGAAVAGLDAQAGGPLSPQEARAQLAWQLARAGEVVVRDLASGTDQVVPTADLLKLPGSLAWLADGRLTVLGSPADDLSRSDVYAIALTGEVIPLTRGEGFKAPVLIDPSGRAVVYQTTTAPTFVDPATMTPSQGGAGRGGRGGRGGFGGGRGGGSPYVVADPATGRTRTVTGTNLTMSADGSTLAWVTRDGATSTIVKSPTLEDRQTVVWSGEERLNGLALSPDGRIVAYVKMPHTDWEIYLAEEDGTERRLTRDIQHDLMPQFLTGDTLLAMMGEGRHRRSHLYELETASRRQIFSNNTIRTISPEYIWVASADGRHLVIQADRDGDTVSPERGITVVDLTRRVTVDDVLARLERQRLSETDLRERMTAAFEPIAGLVRTALARGSLHRVYGYEKALFDFDSKYISQPGNAMAIEYLERTYRSFGYEPELQRFEARGSQTANVLATLRGTDDPDLIYVVSSHFDSGASTAGADDDSSATAALLETARMLAGTPMPATIVFASLTGEEAGLLGSREFVQRTAAAGWNVLGALNNDMIGWGGDRARADNTIRYSNAGIRDLQHGAAFLFTDLVLYDTKYYRGTDAAAFYEAWGDIVGGIGSYPVLANPNYHQPTDFLETLNHTQILETARVTAATVIYLASSPSRLQDLEATRTAAGVNLTWAPSPERGVTSYVVAYGPPADPLRTQLTVAEPRANLPVLPPGTEVAVRAVNSRGLPGWDWARDVLR